MVIIGVCGKPCSGKSFFLNSLNDGDFEIIDCDKLAKSILASNKEIVESILGTINHKEIADIIFNDTEKRKNYLDFIWNEVKIEVQHIIQESDKNTIILDAPLLIESSMDKLCDTVVHFDTKRSLRLQRAKERGWDEEELNRRDRFFK